LMEVCGATKQPRPAALLNGAWHPNDAVRPRPAALLNGAWHPNDAVRAPERCRHHARGNGAWHTASGNSAWHPASGAPRAAPRERERCLVPPQAAPREGERCLAPADGIGACQPEPAGTLSNLSLSSWHAPVPGTPPRPRPANSAWHPEPCLAPPRGRRTVPGTLNRAWHPFAVPGTPLRPAP
jgi:hypothetical protein